MKWVKSTSRAKVKAASQEERIQMWKEHFKTLLGKSPKVTKIINNQLEIKLEQFTQEEFDAVLTKIKNRKAAGLDEILTNSKEDKEIRWLTAPILQRCI